MSVHKSKAAKNFERFHGRKVEKETKIDFTMPKALTFLGRGVAVEYVSDKRMAGRPRKPRLFRHKFGPKVSIYLHPNRRWILIGGGKFRVTDWLRG